MLFTILYMFMAAAALASGTIFGAILGAVLTFIAMIDWRLYWIRREARQPKQQS